MTLKLNGYTKVIGGVLAAILSALGILAYANSGFNERIDSRFNKHKAEFETIQQEQINENKKNLAVLEEKIDNIKDDTEHIRDLLEKR